MCGYKEDYQKRILWYSEELKKAEDIPDSGGPEPSGLDGGNTQMRRAIDAEYRKRHKKLRKR